MRDYELPVTVDLAYAWHQQGDHMTRLSSPVGDDCAPTTVTVWVEHGFLLDGDHPDPVQCPTVTVQVEGTNVRLDVPPAAARRFARLLTDCADEIDPDHQDELQEVKR